MRRTLQLMVHVASTFKTDLHVRTLAVCLVGGRVVTVEYRDPSPLSPL